MTSENIDKSDELADALKYLEINDDKYYESGTATASGAQGDPTHNPKTFTYTSNGSSTEERKSEIIHKSINKNK